MFRVYPYIACMIVSPDPPRTNTFPGFDASLATHLVERPPPAASAALAPIRSLGGNHRARIKAHVLSLDSSDRHLRFGYGATDSQISAYVDRLDFDRDEVFGIYNRRLELLAVAHLAFPPPHSMSSCTEFGVSVLKPARGRGYGARLFERAAMNTRNAGHSQIMIHALSENTTMLRIVKAAGAVVSRDGPDSEAILRLPPATLDSRIAEIVQEHWAQADYRYKQQGRSFRAILANMPPGRIDGRQSGPLEWKEATRVSAADA